MLLMRRFRKEKFDSRSLQGETIMFKVAYGEHGWGRTQRHFE